MAMYDLKVHCKRVKKAPSPREKRKTGRKSATVTESTNSSHNKMMKALENFTFNLQQLKERHPKNEIEANSLREMKIKEANVILALQPFGKVKKANRKLKKNQKHVSFDLHPKIYFDYASDENEYV